VTLYVAFVYHQLDLFNLYDSTEEPHNEKMIELSERIIGQEIVYADGIDFSKTELCGLFRWKAFN
jgi:hypothetical protein